MTEPKEPRRRIPFRRSLLTCGGCCMVAGLGLLIAAMMGMVPHTAFAVGAESGLRVIGAIAVFGCIIAAIAFIDD